MEKAYPDIAWPLKATVASVLDIGVPLVVYGVVPRVISKIVEVPKTMYARVQARALDGLTSLLLKEFDGAGVSRSVSEPYIKQQLYKQWVESGEINKMPQNISKVTGALKESEGKLAEAIKIRMESIKLQSQGLKESA